MSLSEILTHWYSVNKRDLPWRRTENPYEIWLSEIILQQTKVDQGMPYYLAFIAKYPTIKDLANANETEVLKLWQGLGYYSRARNLHATAQYVVNELYGKFPDNYNDLLKLKGVGDYTASAIASICFNEICAVVDGNVYRVLSRYFDINTPINSTEGKKEFKVLAQELIDIENPAEFNQAIMEFGAIQCKPKSPNCAICPLQNSCIALDKNRIDQLPVKIKKLKPVKKHFNFLVFISKDQKTIIEKREGRGIWQNLYQFPLIESKEELGFKKLDKKIKTHPVVHGNSYKLSLFNENTIIHKLSHQHLFSKFWIIEVDKLEKDGVPFNKLKDYPVPVLVSNFIEAFNF